METLKNICNNLLNALTIGSLTEIHMYTEELDKFGISSEIDISSPEFDFISGLLIDLVEVNSIQSINSAILKLTQKKLGGWS